MSKIGSAFGAKKPSTTSIFLSLAKQQKDEKEAKEKLAKFKANQKKLGAGRAGRLGPGGKDEDEETSIRRPGARTATQLGS